MVREIQGADLDIFFGESAYLCMGTYFFNIISIKHILSIYIYFGIWRVRVPPSPPLDPCLVQCLNRKSNESTLYPREAIRSSEPIHTLSRMGWTRELKFPKLCWIKPTFLILCQFPKNISGYIYIPSHPSLLPLIKVILTSDLSRFDHWYKLYVYKLFNGIYNERPFNNIRFLRLIV